MKKISSFWVIIISFLSIFIILNLFISIFIVRNRLDKQNYGDKFVELRSPVRFNLVPNHNNFNIIVFPLKNPALINQNQFKFTIYSNGKVIRELPFSGFNIGDPSDVKFQFEPIENSKNITLEIEIKGEDYRNPILINVDDKGKSAFNAYYRTINKREIFRDIFSDLKIKFSENLGFFISWIIILSGILWWSSLDKKK